MITVKYDVERLVEDFRNYIVCYGYSQSYVARVTGLSESMISRILNGQRTMKGNIAEILTDFMNSNVNNYILEDGQYIVDLNVMNLEQLSDKDLDELIVTLRRIREERIKNEILELMSDIDIKKERINNLEEIRRKLYE